MSLEGKKILEKGIIINKFKNVNKEKKIII